MNCGEMMQSRKVEYWMSYEYDDDDDEHGCCWMYWR